MFLSARQIDYDIGVLYACSPMFDFKTKRRRQMDLAQEMVGIAMVLIRYPAKNVQEYMHLRLFLADMAMRMFLNPKDKECVLANFWQLSQTWLVEKKLTNDRLVDALNEYKAAFFSAGNVGIGMQAVCETYLRRSEDSLESQQILMNEIQFTLSSLADTLPKAI